MVKEYLSQRGVDFEERDISRNPAYAQELVRSTGQMGVPVTIINGQAIIGFNRAQLEQFLGQKQRTSLGAAVADAEKLTSQGGNRAPTGAYVGRIRPGSLAARLGLTIGDIIVEVNKQSVANTNDLERAMARFAEGDWISIVFTRGNSRHATEDVL